MHFHDIREAQRQNQEDAPNGNHRWEEDNMPSLHSGFITATSRDANWKCLLVSVWYSSGGYLVRLQDREREERAFLEIDTLANFWENLEIKFNSGRLQWRSDSRPQETRFK